MLNLTVLLFYFFPKVFLFLCLVFTIVYCQVTNEEVKAVDDDQDVAESANPQWGYGGYGRGPKILF